MKIKPNIPSAEQLRAFLKRYQLVLLVIAAGILLLALPTGKKEKAQTPSGLTGGEEDFSVDALEEKLGNILSQVEGAGSVQVMLTVQSGMERVLATDRDMDRSEGKESVREETVVIASGGSGEEVVLLTQRYPTFQGALVVCRGGDDPQVRLVLTQALSALTGLSSNRITVCKGS